MTKKGARVGVIIGGDPDTKTITFAGYGTYVGDEVPESAIGWMADVCKSEGIPNPKLELDNGEVAWGCETWWGDEDAIKAKLAAYVEQGYTIEEVKMSEYRKSALATMEGQ